MDVWPGLDALGSKGLNNCVSRAKVVDDILLTSLETVNDRTSMARRKHNILT